MTAPRTTRRSPDFGPNIHEHVDGICRRLGIESERVKEMTITPTSATITLYAHNSQNAKYVDGDEAVVAVATFKVQA